MDKSSIKQLKFGDISRLNCKSIHFRIHLVPGSPPIWSPNMPDLPNIPGDPQLACSLSMVARAVKNIGFPDTQPPLHPEPLHVCGGRPFRFQHQSFDQHKYKSCILPQYSPHELIYKPFCHQAWLFNHQLSSSTIWISEPTATPPPSGRAAASAAPETHNSNCWPHVFASLRNLNRLQVILSIKRKSPHHTSKKENVRYNIFISFPSTHSYIYIYTHMYLSEKMPPWLETDWNQLITGSIP